MTVSLCCLFPSCVVRLRLSVGVVVAVEQLCVRVWLCPVW